MRLVAFAFLCFFFISISFAIGEDLAVALNRFCVGVKDMLPSAAMLMVVLGAVIYAAGQLMGAETRARANVWATAALTGAICAILIAVITPVFLKQISRADVACYSPNAIGGCNDCNPPNHCCQCFTAGRDAPNHEFCVPTVRATCSWNNEVCHYA